MISLEFNQLLNYYEKVKANKPNKGPKGWAKDDQHERFFINLGYNKGLNKGGLLRLICSNTNLPSESVGELDLYNDFSFFEMEKSLSEKVLNSLENKQYDGKDFVDQIASKEGKKSSKGNSSKNRKNQRNKERSRRRR